MGTLEWPAMVGNIGRSGKFDLNYVNFRCYNMIGVP
jgi:hypothetical protein